MEKHIGQRLLIVLVVTFVGFIMLWPPSEKLRPGLDIAGGTSLIFEIETSKAENDVNLAERVKTLLQKRVDPSGVYALTWRVHGRSRLEVQMPLPPKDAVARREAFADALDDVYSFELRRGQIETALRAAEPERTTELARLARGRADAALQAATGEDTAARRAAIEKVVADRQAKALTARDRYEAIKAAEAARLAGPPPTQPTTSPADTQPTTTPVTPPITQESLDLAERDASELFEDAIQDLVGTNLNRRRFEEILDLETTSKVRQTSLEQIREKHADLRDKIDEVLAMHSAYRKGKQFLDGPADLKRLLRGAGKLEFRILAEPDPGNPTKYDRFREQLKEGRLRRPTDDVAWFKVDNPMQFFNLESPADLEEYKPENDRTHVVGKLENTYYALGKTAPEDGLLQDVKTQRKWRLERARIDRDEHGRLSVSFQLDVVGGDLFESLTRRNLEKQLCILVDDVAYSAATIKSAIRTNGQITGDFSMEKVSYLVQTMEGGTLPARLKDTPLSERTVGSSLGETNRDKALNAGLFGTLAVVAIMIGYYFFCGAIANVAMLLNVFLTLAALAMLGARITLDGIAGLILSVGMAVDANVLIYERMREEKARGSSLRMVIKNGYDRAFRTIFDSNMTTLLTCLIIYYVGSEEVKGFGLTLGWGIALNLFTAVFVTRTLFDVGLKLKLIKDIKMMGLIGVPNIDWFRVSKVLRPITITIGLCGIGLLVWRGASNVFDIEFLGGVAAEFELKDPKPGQARLDDVEIDRRIEDVAAGLMKDAARLGEATVTAVPAEVSLLEIHLPQVDAMRLAALLTEPLEAENMLARGGVLAEPGQAALRVRVTPDLSADQLATKIHGLSSTLAQNCDNLGRANVNAVLETTGVAQAGQIWNVTTTATNMRLVEYTLAQALGDDMRIQHSIAHVFRGEGERPFPIRDRLLAGVVPDVPPGVHFDLTDYLGGAAIYLDQLEPAVSVEDLRERLDNMHFQPDFQEMPKRRFDVVGLAATGAQAENGAPLFRSVVIVTVDPDIRYQDDSQAWFTNFAQGEAKLVNTALATQQTLRKVMQFKPQIAASATQQAVLALILSWIMISAYIWIRFGRLWFGAAGILALIHDVALALAFVGFAEYLSGGALGRALLIEDFKINMPIVAAMLTIIGYSINDKIVIFDRIRELRGRLGHVSREMANNAINQTVSRTLLTGTAVLVVLVILYIWGGSSIRGFNYCMFIGVVSGTYSSIAIGAPLVLSGTRTAARAT